MFKVVGFKNSIAKRVGVFYSNSINSCEDIINAYNLNAGIILDDSNNKVGFIFNKEGSSEIVGFGELGSSSNYEVCGIFDDGINTPFYVSLDTLEDVHDFMSDKDISFGFIVSNGELEYLIDECLLLHRNCF